MSFGGHSRVAQNNRVLDGGAHRRHLANTTERSVRNGNVSLRQISVTTC